MSQSLKMKNIDKIIPTDHLHNDFLDITVKFGITSLILLFLIYFCIIKTKNKEHKILLNILMIMLLSSQLTQSQFAHHQAITFFITLFYLLRERKLQEKNSE
jgi:O-antigen ligase